MTNEYRVAQSDLTAIADAIRAKVGSADSIAFPDGFTSLIESIASLSPNIRAVSVGTYTATSDQGYADGNGSVTITHNLGVFPTMFFVLSMGGTVGVNSLLAEVHVPDQLGNTANNTIYMSKTSTGKTIGSLLNNSSAGTTNANTAKIYLKSGTYLFAGATVMWMAIRLQG